jgi:3'-phosphoadenosine 5'-phosphosulfate (PAPS) 3'-phosphatase
MVRRKTMKDKRKTIKKMAKHKRSSRRSSKRRSKRKNKNTKRKMRGGETHWENNDEKKWIRIEENEKANNDENKEKIKLLEACLTACESLQPFIQAVYEVLNYAHLTNKEINPLLTEFIKENTTSLSKEKLNEKDIFTIADGMVQYILRNYLFNNTDNFVGEETIEVKEDIDEESKEVVQYTLIQGSDTTLIPKVFTSFINDAIANIKSIELDPTLFRDYTIFVDPIDGTAEYQGTDKRVIKDTKFTQKGEQATTIIGFANKKGKPVGGIMYRPVKNEEKTIQFGTYAYGWVIDENDSNKNVYKSRLNMNAKVKKEGQIRFITSNGSITKPTELLIKEIGGHREGSGGAGNKIMMLLEDKGDVYLQDRGLSRWDICAGDAILRCKGGLLCKLTEFENNGKTDSQYTYRTTTDDIFGEGNPNNNVDKNDVAVYHDQNSVIPKDLVAEFKELKGDKNGLKQFFKLNAANGTGPIHHNATNNLCGMVAITGDKKDILKEIYDKIKELDIKFDYD